LDRSKTSKALHCTTADSESHDRIGYKEFRTNQVARVWRFAAPKAPLTPDLLGKTVAIAIGGDPRDAT
jgi:hypothetical protein